MSFVRFFRPENLKRDASQASITFDEFPTELKVKIFKNLTPQEKIQASAVCKNWFEIMHTHFNPELIQACNVYFSKQNQEDERYIEWIKCSPFYPSFKDLLKASPGVMLLSGATVASLLVSLLALNFLLGQIKWDKKNFINGFKELMLGSSFIGFLCGLLFISWTLSVPRPMGSHNLDDREKGRKISLRKGIYHLLFFMLSQKQRKENLPTQEFEITSEEFFSQLASEWLTVDYHIEGHAKINRLDDTRLSIKLVGPYLVKEIKQEILDELLIYLKSAMSVENINIEGQFQGNTDKLIIKADHDYGLDRLIRLFEAYNFATVKDLRNVEDIAIPMKRR